MTDDNSLEAPSWPQPGDTLLGGTSEWMLNACLRWAHAQPVGYVEGYRRAAQAVFERVEGTGLGMDFMVFPLMFLCQSSATLTDSLKKRFGARRLSESFRCCARGGT